MVKKLKRIIKYSGDDVSLAHMMPRHAALINSTDNGKYETQNEFFVAIDRELEKVVRFYNRKLTELEDQLVGLSRKGAGLTSLDLETIIQDFENINETDSGNVAANKTTWEKNHSIATTMQTFFKDVEHLLETAMSLHSEILLLKSFVKLNYTGFRKILKKYDKKKLQKSQEIYLTSKVNFQPFSNMAPLHEMEHSNNKLIDQLKQCSLKSVSRLSSDHSVNGQTTPQTINNPSTFIDTSVKNTNQFKMASELSDILEHYHKITLNIDQKAKTVNYMENCIISTACDLIQQIKNEHIIQEFYFRACKDNRLNLIKALSKLPQCANFATYKFHLPQYRSLESAIPIRRSIYNNITKSDSCNIFINNTSTSSDHLLATTYIGDKYNPLYSGETYTFPLEPCSRDNMLSPLHIACINDNPEFMVFLLFQGADIGTIDSFGKTPFHYAAAKPTAKCLNVLLSQPYPYNVSPNRVVDELSMELDVDEKLSNALISLAQIPDTAGYTPFFYAILSKSMECVSLLLKLHIGSPSAIISFTETPPLFYACAVQSIEICTLLLNKYGADPNSIDEYGVSVLHLACRFGNADLTKLFLSHNANPNSTEYKKRMTPLFEAIDRNHKQCVELLLVHNAQVNILDKRNLSPYDHAIFYNSHSLFSVLLDHQTKKFQKSTQIKEDAVHNFNEHGNLEDISTQSLTLPSVVMTPSVGNARKRQISVIPETYLQFDNFELPPPALMIKHYGHSYLKSKHLLMINLSNQPFFERKPEKYLNKKYILKFFDEEYEQYNVRLEMRIADEKQLVTLPLENYSQIYSLNFESSDHLRLELNVYTAFGHISEANSIAKTVLFSNYFSAQKGVVTCPMYNHGMNVVGTITFEYYLVSPASSTMFNLGNESKTETLTKNKDYWKAYALEPAVSDQSISSKNQVEDVPSRPMITKTSLKKIYTTISLFVTKDFHFVNTSAPSVLFYPLDIPINHLTLSQLKEIGRHNSSNITANSDENQFQFVCLESSIKYTDAKVPLHLRFPRSPFYDFGFKNKYANELILGLKRYAKHRSIVVSSDDLEFCLLFNSKQCQFPCFIEANSETSIHSCLSFASSNLLLGAIINAEDLIKSPKMHDLSKTLGLLLLAKLDPLRRELKKYGNFVKADGLVTSNLLKISINNSFNTDQSDDHLNLSKMVPGGTCQCKNLMSINDTTLSYDYSQLPMSYSTTSVSADSTNHADNYSSSPSSVNIYNPETHNLNCVEEDSTPNSNANGSLFAFLAG